MHVFQNATQNANGTLASLSGTLRHTGQLFFEDSLGTEVFATDAYTGNTNTRTYNDEVRNSLRGSSRESLLTYYENRTASSLS